MHYSEKPIKLKAISLILLALFFGFSGHSFAEKKNKREEKPTVVLLPVILHGEQSRDSVASYQDAAAESLQSKYKVIVGSKVEEVLKKVTAKESQKENCDLTRCYGAIAVEFNAEYLAVLNVTKSEGDYSFSIKVMDVIANELVISKTDTCPACKAYQVVEKLKLLVPAEKTVKAEKVEKTPAPVVVSEPTPPPAPRAVEKPFVALSVEFLNNFRANDQESLKKFAELADAENVQAQLMMGVKADDAGNFPEAIRWYQRAGGNGYGAGWMMLGTLYASGRGMLKDELQAGALYKKGLETLPKFAEKGDVIAQTMMGSVYSQGLGVPKDFNEAMRWFKKTSELGYVVGQFNMGIMYEYGLGVPKDYYEAVRWYQKAANAGNPYAQVGLGDMYQEGMGVPKDYNEAVRWYQKSAEQGNPYAQVDLGYAYENGNGVPRDFIQAVRWYKKAADQGFALGLNNLGAMYEYGQGVEKDVNEAIRLYKKVAEQGEQNAIKNLKRLKVNP